MPHRPGRWGPCPRRGDSSRTSCILRKAPLCTMQRTVHLAPLLEARALLRPRPGWCALFLKAYGIVAARRPQLRWAYMPWPWPHFYEHPESVASVTVERRVGDEDVVFLAHVLGPQNQSLAALEEHLRHFKTAPIDRIGLFRRIRQISRLPRTLRRLMWWFGLNTSGHRRARQSARSG